MQGTSPNDTLVYCTLFGLFGEQSRQSFILVPYSMHAERTLTIPYAAGRGRQDFNLSVTLADAVASKLFRRHLSLVGKLARAYETNTKQDKRLSSQKMHLMPIAAPPKTPTKDKNRQGRLEHMQKAQRFHCPNFYSYEYSVITRHTLDTYVESRHP